jgi:predicted TIM-barrel fold metal-dependent hydrolase
MKVDVHAHCYPRPYLKELEKHSLLNQVGVGTEASPWETGEERIAQMRALGVDVQVLNVSAPNVYFPDEGLSRALAELTNDFLADVVKSHPEHFLCLASIPLTNLDHAFAELERAMDKLGMDGILLGTNICGRPLSDDAFLPFLQEVERRNITVALHPMRSIVETLMPKEDLGLGVATCVGFLFETTRTIAQMTFKGTLERLPKLTMILPHAGGTIPFAYPRWDLFYRSRPEGHRLKRLSNPPSHYVKRLYYDTALAYHPSTLRCTIDLAGIDHIMFGTDHPYTNDFRAVETIASIAGGSFTAEERDKIFSRNAARLFPRLRHGGSSSLRPEHTD